MRTETKKYIKPFTLACSEGNTANHDQDENVKDLQSVKN